MELFKDMEVLIRYAIPGYVLLLPFALIVFFAHSHIGEFGGILFLIYGFCMGYMLQQIYMFLFEGKRWPFEAGGYASVESGGRRTIIEKVAKQGATLTKNQALRVWEYFIYSPHVTDGLRAHISRSHSFIHSQRTVALACFIGVFETAIGATYLLTLNQASTLRLGVIGSVAFLYVVMGVILVLKARQIKERLMCFEEFIIKRHWKDIKKILVGAEYLHEVGKEK